MTEEVEFLLEDASEQMVKAIDHLEAELAKIRAGKASPALLNGLFVDYYDAKTPLTQVATLSTPDARNILVQPWEKSLLIPIEKAIFAANLGVTPVNDGEKIRLTLPPLTEERRRDMVKVVKGMAEHARVSLRSVRKSHNDEIKKLLKEGLPEDMEKDAEHAVQEITNKYNSVIDKHVESKESEIMTV